MKEQCSECRGRSDKESEGGEEWREWGELVDIMMSVSKVPRKGYLTGRFEFAGVILHDPGSP